MIDLIYSQDAGRRPEVIVTDTGSYSDIVYGVITLLDFDYRPQLADLPDSKLWRIDLTADYGPLNQAARGKLDLTRIRRHWPDIQRLIVSIHTGAISAHDALRILAPGRHSDPARRRARPIRPDLQDAAHPQLHRRRALPARDQSDPQPPRRPPRPRPDRVPRPQRRAPPRLPRRHRRPARRARTHPEHDHAVEHRLPRPRHQRTPRGWLPHPRRRPRTPLAVHAPPHQLPRPLLLQPTRPPRRPPRAPRPRHARSRFRLTKPLAPDSVPLLVTGRDLLGAASEATARGRGRGQARKVVEAGHGEGSSGVSTRFQIRAEAQGGFGLWRAPDSEIATHHRPSALANVAGRAGGARRGPGHG